MYRKWIVLLGVMVFWGSNAHAAYLDNIQGTVLVNRGNGFQTAAANIDLNPGDRVKVVNGTADIVYDHCRTVTVSKGQVIAVVAYTAAKGACTGGYKDAIAAPVPAPDILPEILVAGGLIGVCVGLCGSNPASP